MKKGKGKGSKTNCIPPQEGGKEDCVPPKEGGGKEMNPFRGHGFSFKFD